MIKFGNNNIGKLYFGSNPIGKAYLGSNLVFQQGGGVQPVTTIPYIRGGADGSYIDTGITADNTVRVVIWARNWQPLSEALCGSRTAADSNEYSMTAASGTDVDRVRIRFGTSNAAFSESAINTAYSNYHKYDYANGVLSVDDVVVATATAATFSNNLNIHLFGLNTGGTHNVMKFPVDISACKIYKNDVLVRDFSAVNSPSVGMYDSVSETLFTNAGSGSFTYGGFNKNAYTPLEYIECDGNQYFDTGVKGSYSLQIVTKLRSTNRAVTWMGYMGVFSSSPASCCSFTFGNNAGKNRQISLRLGAATSDAVLYNSISLTDQDIVIMKTNNIGYVYKDNVQLGTRTKTGVATTFETNLTMYVGATRATETTTIDGYFRGRIYYLGLGAYRSFVPAKVNNVVGMYDTYNDVFYPSATSTAFIGGPTI